MTAPCSGSAFAADPADSSTDKDDALVAVVITATKRSSTVQETPISVTAISADEIADRGVVDFDTLAQSVPGMSMRTSGAIRRPIDDRVGRSDQPSIRPR